MAEDSCGQPWHVSGDSHAEPVHLADRALAQAALTGGRAQREALVDRLLDHVHRTVRFVVRRDDIDDYTQQVFFEILRSLPSYKGQSSLETWTHRIAIRTTLRLLKKERRDRFANLDGQLEPSGEASIDENLDREATRRHLARALSRIPKARCEALLLQVGWGYTAPEIAEMTGTRVATVRERLKVARQQLRRILSREPSLKVWLGGAS